MAKPAPSWSAIISQTVPSLFPCSQAVYDHHYLLNCQHREFAHHARFKSTKNIFPIFKNHKLGDYLLHFQITSHFRTANWPHSYRRRLRFSMHEVWYPEVGLFEFLFTRFRGRFFQISIYERPSLYYWPPSLQYEDSIYNYYQIIESR